MASLISKIPAVRTSQTRWHEVGANYFAPRLWLNWKLTSIWRERFVSSSLGTGDDIWNNLPLSVIKARIVNKKLAKKKIFKSQHLALKTKPLHFYRERKLFAWPQHVDLSSMERVNRSTRLGAIYFLRPVIGQRESFNARWQSRRKQRSGAVWKSSGNIVHSWWIIWRSLTYYISFDIC